MVIATERRWKKEKESVMRRGSALSILVVFQLFAVNVYAGDAASNPSGPVGAGEISTLETAHTVVDDFESYTDRFDIYDVWVDGITMGTNGSWAELATAPNDPVHGDSQGLWYYYDNEGAEHKAAFSEVMRPFVPPEDFVGNGEETLVMWFYGQAGNDLEPMWVVLADSNGVEKLSQYGDHGEDPNDILTEDWTQWSIPLDDFNGAGVDLSSVQTMFVGFGNRANPIPGGLGLVYFDDFRLYPPEYIVLEDFESYTPNPFFLYENWVDGVVDGITGSWVELTSFPDDAVHSGDYGMWYHYDNAGFECELPYSEASRVLDPAEDFTDEGEAALVIWFYGQASNDPESMWAVMTDSNGVDALSFYGALGEDPNDILKEQWIEWNIDLQDFAGAGVDLSSVASVGIGFGERDWAGQAQDHYGVVYFDDIRLYPVRCVEGHNGDVNGDCMVDYRDVERVANKWLEGADSTVDLNRDGIVSIPDFCVLGDHWFETVDMWP